METDQEIRDEFDRLTRAVEVAEQAASAARVAVRDFNEAHAQFKNGDELEGRVLKRGYYGRRDDDAGYEWRTVRVERFQAQSNTYRVTVRNKDGKWGVNRVVVPASGLRVPS